MPTTNSDFSEKTTASAVADAFAPQVKDKIIFITGVSLMGIGGQAARAFAVHSPRLLILSGRNENKVREVVDAIAKDHPDVKTKVVLLDLSNQKAVRKAAEEVLKADDIPHLDILINNAGVMTLPTRQLTEDGVEMQFATNHVGHFLFTNLVMPKIINAAQRPGAEKGATRIVNVSSRGIVYSPVRFSDPAHFKEWEELPEEERFSKEAISQFGMFMATKGPYVPQVAYGQSKTANVLFGVELTKQLFEKYGVLSVGLHPGFILTELARHVDPAELAAAGELVEKIGMYRKNLEEGASTTAVAALDPVLTSTDFFLSDCQPVEEWVPAYCSDPAVAERLWHLTEEIVGEKFAY